MVPTPLSSAALPCPVPIAAAVPIADAAAAVRKEAQEKHDRLPSPAEYRGACAGIRQTTGQYLAAVHDAAYIGPLDGELY